ncbi:MAG: alcohol dehydrogenase catalytic domain-containing protein [Verrucomicrobia subdivision 3 bacterium]|nr:alcohol dehydrogenase catalytic domain-containing protein [Limisphaerales bacterium]
MSDNPKTMQAIVYRGVNDLRLEMVPVPRIGANELLVKVAACGVCPTDIKKIHHGTVPPPRIFGHETSGTIVKVGARVRRFKVGDRVALHHHVPCMKCHACRHKDFAQCPQYKYETGVTAGFEPAGGGYAEYVRVMPFVFPGVVRIPQRNSFLEAAMIEPVSTVAKAVRRLRLLRGDHVLVVGQGPIGLMFTRLLALEGMKVIASDLMPERLQVARAFGAKYVTTPPIQRCNDSMIQRLPIDAAVITAPVDTAVQEAVNLVRGGGQVLVFAHTRRDAQALIDLSKVCVDEKDLIGSYSSDVTLQETVAKLVFSRKLDVRKLITHRFPLAQTAHAVELASKPRAGVLKVVVEPTSPL